MRRTSNAMAVALLAAAPLLAACTGNPDTPTTPPATPAADRPATEVPLPTLREAGEATAAYPTSAVTLTVGQRLGVKGVASATAYRWKLTSTGDDAVVRRGPDVVVEPCGTQTGCSPGIDQTFTALTPGSTTLTWVYEPQSGCRTSPPTQPSDWCGKITKSIEITVR